MQVILSFYRNFFLTTLFITIFLCGLIYASASWYFDLAAFWVKLITNALIALYIDLFQSRQLTFYHNLGYGKHRLYLLTFGLDMLIWFLLATGVILLIQ